MPSKVTNPPVCVGRSGDVVPIHFTPESLEKSVIDTLQDVQSHMFGSMGLTQNYPAIQEALAPGLASGDIKVESVGLDDILIALVRGE